MPKSQEENTVKFIVTVTHKEGQDEFDTYYDANRIKKVLLNVKGIEHAEVEQLSRAQSCVVAAKNALAKAATALSAWQDEWVKDPRLSEVMPEELAGDSVFLERLEAFIRDYRAPGELAAKTQEMGNVDPRAVFGSAGGLPVAKGASEVRFNESSVTSDDEPEGLTDRE